MSIHWPIIRRCLSHPLRTVIVDDQRGYRGVELLVGAMHLAAEIERRSRSRTVGVMLPAGGVSAMGALACWIAGRTLVPLNFLLRSEELRYVIRHCETDVVFTVQPILDMLDETPRGVEVVRLEDLAIKGMPEPRWPASAGADDLATILYTSGTSGRPKGVMLSHGNIRSNIRQAEQWIHIDPDFVFLGVLPPFHSFGLTVLTLLPLTVGCKVVYTARFVPQKIVRLLRTHHPTVFVGLPSMYGALLRVKDARREDFESVRYLVSGGEPLPDAIFDRFRERFGVQISEGYGLTETSPVTNWCRPEEFKPHSVGPPMPGLELRIVDVETERIMNVGEEGEIRFRGPNVMRGYFKQPEETAAAFDRDGFFRTGDIGWVDEQQRLTITGRIKEMIIVGGENVFPREIEEVLNKHASVAASAVVGVNDDVRGELPAAFVEVEDGKEFDESALRSWCRERLAGYKVPRFVEAVEELPRNPTGKILRRDLVDAAREAMRKRTGASASESA